MIRLLYVDDNPDLCFIVKAFVESHYPESEISVTTAPGVDEALIIINNDDFDLIVSDYEMPGKNGLELLDVLNSKSIDIPFILYTANLEDEAFAIMAKNRGVKSTHCKGDDTYRNYMTLICKICRTVRDWRIDKGLTEYVITNEIFFQRLEKELKLTLAKFAAKLNTESISISLLAEDGEKTVSFVKEGVSTPLSVIKSPIVFKKTTLGEVTATKGDNFTDDNLALIDLLKAYVANQIKESLSRPDNN